MKSPEDDASLGRLAGQLGVQLTCLVLPLAAVLFLPLSLGVAGWLILLVSEWLLSKLKGQVPFWAQRICIWWTFGLGLAVFRQMNGFWAIPAALLTIVLGLWIVSKFERRLGLKLEPSPHSSASSARPIGASAWGGGAPTQTPEGEPVRLLYEGEFAMGGPVISTYLLPDGIIVESASPSARFSPDGRYFVSPMPSRNDWGLLILDRTEKCLYLCVGHPAFWELDEVSDTTISGRESPLTSNAVHEADIATLKRGAQREPLMAFHDLWLQASQWRAHLPDESLRSIQSSHIVHLLQSQVRMPPELRACEDPLDAIAHPRAELIIDGEPTGMLAFLPIEPIWRPDGKAFAVRAAQAVAEDAADEWWHWSERGFQRLGLAWHKASAEPDLMSGEGLALDHAKFTLTAELGTPSLSYGDWGEFHGTTYAEQGLMIGRHDEGIARIHPVPLREVVIALPVDRANTRGYAVVESAETCAGRARFQWLRDDAEASRGAYSCSIGTWQLPGTWLLDHVVSDCGRYLALIGFAEAPAVPHRVVVVDVQEAALHEVPEAMPNAQFQAFVMGRLQLLRLLGRINYVAPTGPGQGDPGLLRRIDEAVPEASQAYGFTLHREDSRLFYEIERIDVDGAALTRVPTTRACRESPAANADGAFMLASPDGRDRAWGFGFTTRHSHDTPAAPRMSGYVLTGSGIGIPDIAPTMMWSNDSRYLALVRHVDQFHPDNNGRHDQWWLLLLDRQEKTLRRYDESLGSLPRFLAFDENLHVEASDVSPDSVKGTNTTTCALDTLLKANAEPLERAGACWLPASELRRAHYWQRLVLPTV